MSSYLLFVVLFLLAVSSITGHTQPPQPALFEGDAAWAKSLPIKDG